MKHLLLLFLSNFAVTIYSELDLFKKFPLLQEQIPHVTLCDLPTPIVKLENFGNYVGCKNIFMKRDDLTGRFAGEFRLYGGNKPRKLEFLLADALKHDAQTVLTYGCVGSNHALATAVYAHELGLKAILMLKDQPNSSVVRHNLLLDHYYHAHLNFCADHAACVLVAQEIMASDKHVYAIPTGGSNVIGVIGFVNAAFELAQQINMHEMIEPDEIYVATGSCATTAGLLLGLKAVQLKSKVVAVCITPEGKPDVYLSNIKRLFEQTNQMLHFLDESFPILEFPEEDLILNKKFCGVKYGLLMPETALSKAVFQKTENITLEDTYSAKPIAAIMDNAANGELQDKVVLFWNTYCGLDFSHLTDMSDYKKLPDEFHLFFE
jgi:1-aminocyclopropane-1-carboxylate deaminase/D-cysteine desulfhydrase-like pyridoxal-dependent ACC family enzyme